MTLCTLDDVKLELKGDASKLTANDTTWLSQRLRVVSDAVARLAGGYGFDFEPRFRTERFTPSTKRINSFYKTFNLGKDLLEATSIIADGTTLTLDSNVYYEPLGQYPVRALRIDPDATTTWWPCNSTCDPYNTITVAGFWGFRRYYDTEGFLQVDSLSADITAGATTMTVADADGADYYGLTPRFSVGGLYRIENELVEATAVNTSTNVVTILRAQRGTTAAAHVSTTAVKFWYAETEIRHAAARQVALMYARRGAYQQVVTEFGSTSFPADLVSDLRAAIGRLANL